MRAACNPRGLLAERHQFSTTAEREDVEEEEDNGELGAESEICE